MSTETVPPASVPAGLPAGGALPGSDDRDAPQSGGSPGSENDQAASPAQPLANARLGAETQRRLQAQRALSAASALISSSLDLPAALNGIAEQLGQMMAVTAVTVYHLEPQRDRLTVAAEYVAPDAAQPPSGDRATTFSPPVRLADLGEQFGDGRPAVWQAGALDLPPFFQRRLAQTGGQTILSLPLSVAGSVIALTELVAADRQRVFAAEEVELVQAIAQQAAIALENRRLHDEAARSLEELTTLNQISQAITSTLDLQEILALITRHALPLLGVEAASVALLDEEQDDLWYAAASGGGAEYVRGRRLSRETGLVGWVVTHGQPLIIADVDQDRRHFDAFDQLSGFQTRSVLCVPLQVKGQIIGAIGVMNKHDGPFGDEDVRLLSLLAAPAATAIENARLYQRARQEINERRRAERNLELERASLAERVAERTAELSAANVELARAARLKDEFLASMSHELRTPLNAILGIAEGLQEQSYGPLNERQLHTLTILEASGRHLLALINDLLDVAKIEAGQMDLEIGPTYLREVCQASVQFVQPEAERKAIEIVQVVDDGLELVLADGRRLKQILINLLSNAVKFTPEKGQVGLEATGDPDGHQIQLAVWDTGIGIEAADISRLFQPFVQLDSALSRQYPGSGLGLTIAARMTELHGGGLMVTSEPGQGSRFTVTLPWRLPDQPGGPAAEQEQPATTAVPLPANMTQAPLILLVDDEKLNTEIFRDLLKTIGCRVIVAHDGEAALQLNESQRPDLILMDIMMPRMSGLEAIEQIRCHSTHRQVPIVALTALAMEGDRERCLNAGATDYLSKPVRLAVLEKTIQQQLGWYSDAALTGQLDAIPT